MTLARGTRLGAYEILAPLGAGGMGEVYRARDAKLDREVAVKVLPSHLTSDADSLARFEREAKAVAALSHPNILAIYDFGSEGGVSYAVTELLQGETLRSRVAVGPLSPRTTVDYATQIASGLAAAHERGIVHRDLKPENVFVTRDGHVKILDFGLARRDRDAAARDESAAPTQSGHTEPGTVMGTVGYMSPEQVRGLPADHRSDIFSFGAILYEMLSGRRAFAGATPTDTMAAIMRDDPAALSDTGRGMSAGLDRVVRHCLEKDAANRFQSARDVAFALTESEASGPATAADAGKRRSPSLRWIAAAVAVLVLAAALVLVRRPREATRTAAAAGPRRIAVLPFENLGAAEDDYFADGIADEIRGKLTSLPRVEVIARASSTPYKKTTRPPQEIARELGVGYLLTATVRWQKAAGASRVLVSPELVEVSASATPTSRWQQTFDASITDVFRVQSDIATRVAESLGVALGAGEEKRLADRPTQNLAAYDAFLKGEDVWKGLAVGDPPGVRRALGFYDQAVALDPAFAQAWARISWASSSLYRNSDPSPAFSNRAREAAEKAIALAPDGPDGYHALGNYRRLVLQDAPGSLEEYDRGLRLEPAHVDMLTATAMAEESLGRWESSVAHLQQAERIDPRSARTSVRLGEALNFLRRPVEARAALDRALAFAPGNRTLVVQKVITFLAQGQLESAREVIRLAMPAVGEPELVAYTAAAYDLPWVLTDSQRALLLRLTPTSFADDRVAWAFALAQASYLAKDGANVRRYAEEARRGLEEQLAAAPDETGRRGSLAVVLAYLGRRDDAIRECERIAASPSKDVLSDTDAQESTVVAYALTGELQRSLDMLESLMEKPYYLTPGWLRIDPSFDPLRKEPRFQKLAAGRSDGRTY